MASRLREANGRWAPSPTGHLHLGNLRTALLAWLFARSQNSNFFWRFEDLGDASKPTFCNSQLTDVALIGVDWDNEPIKQSDRLDYYLDSLNDLKQRGLTYRCWCSRREIRDALEAPHGLLPEDAYPGTCRRLSQKKIKEYVNSGKPPSVRLASNHEQVDFLDRQTGRYVGTVDDFVLQRSDGMPAYNLTVIVDDHLQNIREVVRGNDLLSSTPRQIFLCSLLGLNQPRYAHVPLVLGPSSKRLTKRDGAITLSEQINLGLKPLDITNMLLESLNLPTIGQINELYDIPKEFRSQDLPKHPWILDIG